METELASTARFRPAKLEFDRPLDDLPDRAAGQPWFGQDSDRQLWEEMMRLRAETNPQLGGRRA